MEIIGHSLALQGRAVVLVAAIEVAERVAAHTSRRQSALAPAATMTATAMMRSAWRTSK